MQKCLYNINTAVFEWPSNLSDLNPIEDAQNYKKYKLKKTYLSSIKELQEILIKLMVHMDREYFENLVTSI